MISHKKATYKFNVPALIEHQVLWLKVPVHYILRVQILEGLDDAGGHEPRRVLGEEPVLLQDGPHIAP